MKSKLLFLFLVLTQFLFAQNFTEMMGTPFDGVGYSSTAFADVDGDNDPDVLITGLNSSYARITKLYTNDGSGSFTEMMGTPFDGVEQGSIAFADVDGDNDPDVLITGITSGNDLNFITKLYTNDGSGSFTEMMGTPFASVAASSIAFSDVDGDNDPDVLITGVNNSLGMITKLYTNDGSGNFTEMMGTPFDGVRYSSTAFSDVDGDNDPDVLIAGQTNSGVVIAKLYTNDGSGNFTEMMGTPFDDIESSSIAFSDVDRDNDPDVLITGLNSSSAFITKLYTNDGSGSFTEMMGTPFDGVVGSSIAFSDVDGDNDPDVLITGINSSYARITKLYTNDGSGSFTEMMGTPFDGVGSGSMAFADVDGDNDPDVLITGRTSSGAFISKLYTNDGVVSFTDDLKTGLSFGFMHYPNPSTTGTLFISYDAQDNGDVTIKVLNTNGVLLQQQKEFATLGQQVFSIDIASLPQGNYFIELDNGKRKVVAKFIVQ